MTHRGIPCIYRTHLDDEEIESPPQTLQPFESEAALENYEDWIICR